jgi:acetyl/propionyl-CoA carboxylase alpha subunit
VALQIRIARDEPLPFSQDEIKPKCHAVEVRLYAEDPKNDFLPATGQLLAYRLPLGNGVRVDNGFTEGMQVSAAFDPMLAKVITHGTDRDQAIERARKALRDTVVLGVTTNVDYLIGILSHPAYQAGQVHTGFIPRYGEDLNPPPLSTDQRNLLLAAVALSSREFIDPAFEVPEPYASLGNWRN